MSSTPRARTLAASLAAVLALGGLAGCGPDAKSSSSATTTASGGIAVTDAWARESAMSSGDGAAYFTVTNGGKTDDELTGVSVPTDIAESAQMHETVAATDDTMAGGMSTGTSEGAMSTRVTVGPVHETTETTMAGDGMMTMKEVTSVTIRAGGDVHFEPGGYHVMLIELVKPLEVGQTIPLTLTFAMAGTIEVTATVRAS